MHKKKKKKPSVRRVSVVQIQDLTKMKNNSAIQEASKDNSLIRKLAQREVEAQWGREEIESVWLERMLKIIESKLIS